MGRNSLKFSLIIFIVLLFGVVGVASAGVITPPLADDPSLVIRIDFEMNNTVNSVLTNYYNFEAGDSTGWTVETSSSYAPSINWTYTGYEGNYAVKMTNTLGGVGKPRYGYIRQNITLDPLDYKLKFYVSYWLDYWGPIIGVRLKDGNSVVKEWEVHGTGSRKSSDWKLVEFDLTDLNINGTKEYTVEIFLEDLSESHAGEGNHGGWIAVDYIVVEQALVYGSRLVEGRYGYGLDFDGNDYVKVINIDSELFNGSYTVTLWVSKSDSAIRGLLEIGTAPNNCIRVFSWNYNVEWDIYKGEIGNLVAYNVFNDGKMHFLAFVYDHSTTTAKVYVDGVLKVSKNVDMRKAPVSYIRLSAYHTYLWIGKIDEFRIYNRALSDEEIKVMYEALRIRFYDESTSEKIKANATIFNANHSINLQVDSITKEAVLFHSQVPEYGEYYLTATANDYATRHRVIQLSNDSLTEVDVYLPKSSESIANVIVVNDIVGELTSYQNYIRLSVGNKTIEEQKLQYGSSPTELKAYVYLLRSKPYIITVYNEHESRCLGWIYPSLDGYIYLHVSQLNYSKIRGDLPVQYNVTSTNETIRVWYETVYGETTSAKVVITDRNGTVVFEQTLNTPEGVVTFLKNDSDEDYIVKLEIDNSVEKVKYSNLVLGSGLAIKLPQLDVGIEGYNLATLPAWMRATFFGGLCIFTALLFKKRFVPVGLTLSLALAVIFTNLGILELPNTLLTALFVLVGLAYFVWWRK